MKLQLPFLKSKTKEIAPANEIAPKKGDLNVQALIGKALEGEVSMEVIERFLAVRDKLKAEAAKEAYFADFSKFQGECPVINKNTSVSFQNRSGGWTKYNYADLGSIMKQVSPLLGKHGFSFTITTKQTADSVTAYCNSHHISGHTEVTDFTAPIDMSAKMNAAQKVASALTYAKRYAFCDAFGIMTGDDDDDSNVSDLTGPSGPVPPGKKIAPQKPVQNERYKKAKEEIEALLNTQIDGRNVYSEAERKALQNSVDFHQNNHEQLKKIYREVRKNVERATKQ